MFESKTLRATLAGTTALIGVAFPTLSKQIMAATITTAQTTPFVMGTGDILTVSNTGSISGFNAVDVNVAAVNIANSGSLLASSQGISLGLGGSLSGGIANEGEVNGGFAGVFLGANSTISGLINNSGLLHGGTDGISVTSGSHISGVDNTGGSGTISGGNTGIDVINGSSVSGNITNGSGTMLGSASDGIDVDNNSSIGGGVINDAVIHGGHGNAYELAGSDPKQLAALIMATPGCNNNEPIVLVSCNSAVSDADGLTYSQKLMIAVHDIDPDAPYREVIGATTPVWINSQGLEGLYPENQNHEPSLSAPGSFVNTLYPGNFMSY